MSAPVSLAEGSRIGDVPAYVHSLGMLDPTDARILLSHALGFTHVQLITRSEQVLEQGELSRIADLFARRIKGEPVAYLTGEREFFGLSFFVTPAVLIPRPETELLVERALECLPTRGSALDLGTGSGAIPIALAHMRPDAQVSGLDISASALEIAQRNAARHKVSVRFFQSDWYSAVGDARYDLLLANPPYIAAGDRHLAEGDLRFEPANALTDYSDGLAALRALVVGADMHLTSGGWLLMEHGYDQSEAVQNLLMAARFTEVQSWPDLAGIMRVTGGRRLP